MKKNKAEVSTNMPITKTEYVQGIGCTRALWLEKYKPDASGEPEDQVSKEQGILAGELARDYYGSHEIIPFRADYQTMTDATRVCLDAGIPVICEASFAHEDTFCRVDILLNRGRKKVEIVEVKSSSKVKPEHIDDVAFQTWVLEKNGFTVDKATLMHVNGEYTRNGTLDIHQLFIPKDITEEVRARLPGVEDHIRRLRVVLSETTEPIVGFSVSCKKCKCWKYCSRNLPRPNVFDLPGTGSVFTFKHMLKIFEGGDVEFDSLRGRPELRERQVLAVEGYLDGKTILHKEKIKSFLSTLSYPMYFLDYEGINPAIPPYDGTRPHHQTPFQYSLHWLEYEGGELHHTEFLGNPEVSPLRELAEHLCKDIPKDVCVIVYNDSYEKPVTRRLAELYPDLADHLLNICENIKDLMIPFKNLDYYLPAMMGSYSIKYVLPALYPGDPELDYHNLSDVHKGTEASAAFMHMANMPAEEREALRRNMLKYCCLDTYAMVKVWQRLLDITKD